MDQRVLQSYRLVIGLTQGLFLFGLQHTFVTHSWPATNAYLFAALVAFGFFVPLIAISGSAICVSAPWQSGWLSRP